MVLPHVVTECVTLIDAPNRKKVLKLFWVEIAFYVVGGFAISGAARRLLIKDVVKKTASKLVIGLKFDFDCLDFVEFTLCVKLTFDDDVVTTVDDVSLLDVEVLNQVLNHPAQRYVIVTKFFISNFDIELDHGLVIINVDDGVQVLERDRLILRNEQFVYGLVVTLCANELGLKGYGTNVRQHKFHEPFCALRFNHLNESH